MNRTKKGSLLILFVATIHLSFDFFAGETHPNKEIFFLKEVEKSGDLLQIALPLSSLYRTILACDPLGTYSLCLAISSSTILTWIPKIILAQRRPNGGRHSMPSGHTSLSFSSALFALVRYGPHLSSLAATGAASFVAFSRVYTGWHSWYDIIVGLFIGIFSALFWTKRRMCSH